MNRNFGMRSPHLPACKRSSRMKRPITSTHRCCSSLETRTFAEPNREWLEPPAYTVTGD